MIQRPPEVVPLFVLATAIIFCLSLPALAQTSSRRLGLLGAGVPIPIRIIGFHPSVDGSDASYERLLHYRTGHHLQFSKFKFLYGGFRFAVTWVRITGAKIELRGVTTSIGPELLLHTWLGAANHWFSAIGIGPTLTINQFRIDAKLRGNLPSWGLQTHVMTGRVVQPNIRVIADVGFEYAFPAMTQPTFFNHPLGESIWVTICVGALFNW